MTGRGRIRERVLLSLLLLLLVTPASKGQPSAIAAVVDGRTITLGEVDAAVAAKLLPLQQQIYNLRKSALDGLVARAVLEQEAKRRGVSVETLRAGLSAGAVQIDPDEMEKAYAETAPAFGTMGADEIRERVRLQLEASGRMKNYHAAMARLTEQARVELRLEEPRIPAGVLSDRGPVRGAAHAPVTITEYADFECPFCKSSEAALAQLLEQRGDRVKLVFRHLPMDGHRQALPAARLAVCADEQGAFWKVHDALFSAPAIDAPALEQISAGAVSDRRAFEACLASSRPQAAIAADVSEAKRLGISGTPTFLINGRLVNGALSSEQLLKIVDDELRQPGVYRAGF